MYFLTNKLPEYKIIKCVIQRYCNGSDTARVSEAIPEFCGDLPIGGADSAWANHFSIRNRLRLRMEGVIMEDCGDGGDKRIQHP